MDEFLMWLLKEKMKKDKDIKENFRSAEELGLKNGDMIIFKDGEVLYVTDPEDELFKYKNIAEVKRPIEWEEIKVKIPRKRRFKKEEK